MLVLCQSWLLLLDLLLNLKLYRIRNFDPSQHWTEPIRMAQRKRGGPITHRSQDRNLVLIDFLRAFRMIARLCTDIHPSPAPPCHPCHQHRRRASSTWPRGPASPECWSWYAGRTAKRTASQGGALWSASADEQGARWGAGAPSPSSWAKCAWAQT